MFIPHQHHCLLLGLRLVAYVRRHSRLYRNHHRRLKAIFETSADLAAQEGYGSAMLMELRRLLGAL